MGGKNWLRTYLIIVDRFWNFTLPHWCNLYRNDNFNDSHASSHVEKLAPDLNGYKQFCLHWRSFSRRQRYGDRVLNSKEWQIFWISYFYFCCKWRNSAECRVHSRQILDLLNRTGNFYRTEPDLTKPDLIAYKFSNIPSFKVSETLNYEN